MNYSNADKELLINNQAVVYSKILLYDEEGNLLHTFTEDDFLVDWEYEDFKYVPNKGVIGEFVERLLDGNLKNIPDNISLENKEIELQVGISNITGGDITYYSYGRFIITSIGKTDTSGNYKFESSDYTKKFNVIFDGNSITYPCTAMQLLDAAATQANVFVKHYDDRICCIHAVSDEDNITETGEYCIKYNDKYYKFSAYLNLKKNDCIIYMPDENKVHIKYIQEDDNVFRYKVPCVEESVTTATELSSVTTTYHNFTNNDFVIENNQFEENNSCRDVIKAIAKLSYTFARIDENNELVLDELYNTPTQNISEYNIIDTDKYYEAKVTGDTVKPVNKISIGMSNVEGENVTIGETECKYTLNKLSGDTYQYTTIGKNHLDKNAITYGKAWNNTSNTSLATIHIPCKPNTTYTLSSDITLRTTWLEKTSAEATSYIVNRGNVTPSLPVTYTTTATSNVITLQFEKSNINANDLKNIQLMLEEGQSPTAYEPYTGGIPSPNPSYPQEVVNVRGDNTIVFSGKNRFDKNTMVLNAYISYSNGALADSDIFRTVYLKCKPNTTYTFSQSVSSNRHILGFTSDNNISTPKTLTNLVDINNTFDGEYTFTTNFDTKYIFMMVSKTDVETSDVDDILNSIQIEEGSEATEYEVYYTKEYPINLPVENLFNMDFDDTTGSGVTKTLNDDGSITLDGYTTAGHRFDITDTNVSYKAGKQYTVSIEVLSGSFVPYYSNANWAVLLHVADNIEPTILSNGNKATFTINTSTNVKPYLWFGFNNSTTENDAIFDNFTFRIQIEEGNVANTFTPYGVKPIELAKLNDYTYDTIGKENGKWYISKCCDRLNLTNDLEWIDGGGDTGVKRYYTKAIDSLVEKPSDYDVKVDGYSNIGIITAAETWYGTNFGVAVHPNGSVYVDQSIYNTLDTKNVYLYYKLDNYAVEEITYQPLLDQLNAIKNISFPYDEFTIESFGKNNINSTLMMNIVYPYLAKDYETGSHIDITDNVHLEESMIRIDDNPLTYTEQLRRIAINGGYNQTFGTEGLADLMGLTYTPMTVQSIGHPWLLGNNLVKVENLSEEELYFYPFDRKITYKGYIKTELSSQAQNEVSQKYQNNNNVVDRMSHTEIVVDKANKKIESIAQEVTETTDKMSKVTQDINGVSTQIENINKTVDDNTKEIAAIQETIDGLSVEKSVTGGNNLIKNSVGYFGNDFWMIDDSNEGNIKTLNNIDVKNNSISACALLLQNETVYQKITEIKNGSYYISFRYKKLLNLATCKLVINGEEFELTSDSWRDEGKELAVTSNNIQISLISDMDDSCLITDLIVSNGTKKVSWTQNANETYTDGVKIGKGITITATGSDTELSATASSIDIINTRNRESTSTFDKYGIKTNSLESKGTVRIADKLIISKVGDQMWISTL